MYSYTIQIDDALVEGVQATFPSSIAIDQWLQEEAVKSLQERILVSKIKSISGATKPQSPLASSFLKRYKGL